MKTLEINSLNGYINLQDLPNNCIFNKVVTGCGATTVALFNNQSYIVAVPTTELIVNKTGLKEAGVAEIVSPDGKRQTVFGLFGIFSYNVKKELTEYVSRTGIKKIMCTYDKVQYLSSYLEESEYKLLVDEYHILLKAYSYRNKAVNGVLDNFRKYKSFCFMSATPISPEFTPSVLSDIELVEAQWKETDLLTVKLDQTNKPYVLAANYINAYKRDGAIMINGAISYEAFFFVNSVNDIASILKYCNLTNEEVKIVCADNASNRMKLEGYTITNSRSENKPFTFITSKSFEGADYFSETGMCFVVSNSNNKNTLLDISTDIYQIAGRIRTETNPFRNLIIHIFNSAGQRNLNLNKSWNEMVADTNTEIEGANKIIQLLNTDEAARVAGKRMINSQYISEDENGKFFLNDMLVKLDLFTYKIEQVIYKSGIALRKEYNKLGVATAYDYSSVEGNISKANKKLSFKEAFIRYAELANKITFNNEIEQIANIQPLVVPAFNKLGSEKVKSLKYIKKAVEEAIKNEGKDIDKETRAAQLITSRIGIGFISLKTAKEIINECYNLIGIERKGKAADLTNWFNCTEVNRRLENKRIKGYEIYSQKIIFNGNNNI